MTVKLSSLRVSAEMDVSQYVRAAAQKVAADSDMAGSAKAVGQALAATDAATSKAVPGVASLSRVWITGYGDAARFEGAVRSIGRALDRGMDPGRAAAQLDGVYRKFGQTADAASLARQGFVALAPVVAALNERYDVTAVIADRAAAATRRLTDAQEAQRRINTSFGIGASAGSAEESANAFLASVGGLEGVAAARGRAVAESFTAALNAALIADAPKSAKQSAGAFTAFFDEIAVELKRREADIASAAARIQTVQERLQQVHRIGYQFDNTPGARASMSAFIEADEAAVRSLTQAYDPLLTNEQRRNEALKTAQGLLARRSIDEKQYATVVTNINKVHDDTKKALEGAFTATGKYTSGVGLARHELINLSRQIQDIGVSLASGQSFLTVLIQQGSQVADVFASSRGSVSGFITEIGPMALRALPALTAVIAALTAMYAAFKITSEQQTLSNSLLGAGRAAGLTGGQLEGLARESAQAADVTVSNARLIGAEYVKLGRIANDNLPKLTQITKDFAAATGQDLKSSAQEIAQALADPARGAQGLSDKIGGLDSTTLRMIRTATDFNDKLRAQKLLMEELGRATDNAADQSLSKWDRLTKEMGLVFGQLKEGAAGAILGPDRSEEVNAARARIRVIEQQLKEGGGSSSQSTFLRAEIEILQRKLAVLGPIVDKEREAARVKAEANASSRRINEGEAVALATGNQGLAQQLRLYNETIGRVNTLDKSLEELRAKRNAIGVPDDTNRERFAILTQQIKEQTEALEGQRKVARDLQSITSGLSLEQERARRNTELDLKASQDKTLADVMATAAERVRINMLGEAGSTSREAAAIKQAEREATVRGTAALNEQSKAIQDGVAVSNAQTDALRRGGVAAAEVARIRKEAEQQARTTGGDAEVIFRERLNKEIAETKRGLAEKLALQKQEVSAATAANSAAVAGNLSAKQRADLEERLRVERETYNKLIATGLVGEREAARMAREQANSISRSQAARTDSDALDFLYQQRQALESQRKQIELVAQTRSARYEELEVLRAQQYLVERGISQESERGKEIINNARLIGQQNKLLEQQERIQQQIRQAQEFAADSLKSFLDELLTGTEGLNGALKSLGKGFLSASLDALISGRGPMGGLSGFASNDNSKQGGILGLLTGNLKPLSDAVAKGTAKGSAEGFETGWHRAASNDNFSLFGNINGKDLAGGLTAIAGLAGAYGSGMAAGSYAQAGIGGALSGGLAGLSLAGTGIGASLGGAAVLGPIGLLAGAGLAIFGQQQAQKQAKKEQRRQAYQAYREAEPQIAQLGSQFRGDPQGTMAQRITEAEASARRLGDIAVVAGREQEWVRLYSDFVTYKDRIIGEFRSSFDGMIDAFTDGTGPNSPFASARDSVKSLGDQLKVFVDDAKTTFGASAPQIDQAREAARTYALSVLDGAREMSVVATRMEEIRGAGAGLQQVLTDLGMAADDAARAVQDGTVAALARLKSSFEDSLGRKTNSALDKGYLNEAADLIKELATLRTDAAALGTDQGLVTDYFKAQAQSIVDGAELTGEAFADLIRRFPALNGYVSEFAEKIDAAAKAAEVAARRLGYQDRLFAALNDTTTLEGQLAAFDRGALREREAELKAGGEAINELETALAAERLKIIADFADQAAQEQKQALQEAQNFFDTFSRNLKQFVDNMRAGADTPLSPEARLAAAQSQYNAQLALAQGGNRDAINGLTGYADALLDAGRAFYGSTAAFQNIFSQIEAQLTALPTQVSAEQFIVNAVNDNKTATVAALATMQSALANSFQVSAATGSAGAIASALSVYFNALDANTDNLLSSAEYFAGLGPLATSAEQTAARAVFASIDADGDGQLSRLELIRAATQENVAEAEYTNALLAQGQAIEAQTQNIIAATRDLQTVANSVLWAQSGMLSSQTALLDQIRALNDTSAGTLSALNNQFSLNDTLYIGPVALQNNMVTALNKIVYNTAGTWSAVAKGIVPAAYAEGGWISGPGTGTSDSILLRASNGEFMVNAAAAARNRSTLEAINGGADVMRAAPMIALPVAPMAPSNSNSSTAELRMLREEVRALRAEMERNTRAVAAGAEHVREGVDESTAAQREGNRELAFRKRA